MADGKNLTKAREHLAKGEKTLVKFSFFGNGSKFEDAAECFDDAGKMFVVPPRHARVMTKNKHGNTIPWV